MPNNIPLTADEIRSALAIRDCFIQAQARAQMAQELEAQLMAKLRAKYGLDEKWQCFDVLDGFTLGDSEGAGEEA